MGGARCNPGREADGAARRRQGHGVGGGTGPPPPADPGRGDQGHGGRPQLPVPGGPHAQTSSAPRSPGAGRAGDPRQDRQGHRRLRRADGRDREHPRRLRRPHFNQEMDRSTGYRTHTILCVHAEQAERGHRRPAGAEQADGSSARRTRSCSSRSPARPPWPSRTPSCTRTSSGSSRASSRLGLRHRVPRPTTSGHSDRVAVLTVGWRAGGPDRHRPSPPSPSRRGHARAALRLAPARLRQGRRPRAVLVKARKLYEHDLDLVVARFKFIRKGLENDTLHKKLGLALSLGSARSARWRPWTRTCSASWRSSDEYLRVILRPTSRPCCPRGVRAHPRDRANTFEDGRMHRPTSPPGGREPHHRQGSLNPRAARDRVPRDPHLPLPAPDPLDQGSAADPDHRLRHHEKLNGQRLPNALSDERIPFQAKLMTVCDIYDALSAPTAPTRRPWPRGRLDILHMEVRDGNLDPDLVQVFIEGDVWRLTTACARSRPQHSRACPRVLRVRLLQGSSTEGSRLRGSWEARILRGRDDEPGFFTAPS